MGFYQHVLVVVAFIWNSMLGSCERRAYDDWAVLPKRQLERNDIRNKHVAVHGKFDRKALTEEEREAEQAIIAKYLEQEQQDAQQDQEESPAQKLENILSNEGKQSAAMEKEYWESIRYSEDDSEKNKNWFEEFLEDTLGSPVNNVEPLPETDDLAPEAGAEAGQTKQRGSAQVDAISPDASIAETWELNPPSEWSELKELHGTYTRFYQVMQSGRTFLLQSVSFRAGDTRMQFDKETETMKRLAGKQHTAELLRSANVGDTGFMLINVPAHPRLVAYVKAAVYLGWISQSILDLFTSRAIKEIGDAISYIHAKGIAHGNLNLGSVFVSELAQGVSVPPTILEKNREFFWQDKPGFSDVFEERELKVAIEDLRNGRVPAHFVLSDFGMSKSLADMKDMNQDVLEVLDELDGENWLKMWVQLSDPWGASGKGGRGTEEDTAAFKLKAARAQSQRFVPFPATSPPQKALSPGYVSGSSTRKPPRQRKNYRGRARNRRYLDE